MMDVHSNPRAVAAARRVQAETGFDVLDDAAVGRVTAMCAGRRARARRSAAISGVLVAALLAGITVAGVLGRVHAYELILGLALLLFNGFRLATAVVAARRLGRIPRSIEAARAGVLAAAAGAGDQPGVPRTAGRPAAPWLPSDAARWN